MATNLERVGQLWVELEDNFGVKNAAPAMILLKATYDAPDYKEDMTESPEQPQGLEANEMVRGPTGPGDFQFVTYWQAQGSGAVDKTAYLTKTHLGYGQLAAGVWKESVIDATVTNNVAPTTTGCDLDGTPATGILETHIGGLISVENADGLRRIRQLTSVAINNPSGYDRVTWTPALDSAPAVGTHIYAVRTMYPLVDGSVAPSLQISHKGQHDDDIIELLGCCGDLTLDLDPGAKPPFCKMTHKMKYASHGFGTPVALAFTADDNTACINLSGGMEVLVCGYAAGARETTRTAVAASSVQIRCGFKLEPNLNGNYPNNIGGWTINRTDDIYSVSLRFQWKKAPYMAWIAGTNYHILIVWGRLAAAQGAAYFPKMIYKGIKRVKLNGQWYVEAVFRSVHPTDANSSPVNAVDAAPMLLGHLG